MVRISVDHENNAEEFWGELVRVHPCPPVGVDAEAAFNRLMESGVDEVVCENYAAAQLRTWFETLPGWNDGPEHAPHPVTFDDVEESQS